MRTPQKLMIVITTMNKLSQIAGLISYLQNWMAVAAALISAGQVMASEYPFIRLAGALQQNSRHLQKFHPIAAPMAGSIKFAAWRTNPPVKGIKAEISPEVKGTLEVIVLMNMYPSSVPTGPALAIAFPEARNSPVP